MKKLLLTMLLVLTSFSAYAQYGYDRMVLRFKDGSCEEFPLNANVKVKIKGDDYIIISDGVHYTYPRTQLVTVTYGLLTDAIQNVTDDRLHYTQGDKQVTFGGVERDGHLEVFTLDGRLVLNTKVSPESNTVSTAGLVPGIYLMRMNGKTNKVTIR